MIVNYEEALKVFNELDPMYQNPYLHPDYVKIDAKRDVSLESAFFVYRQVGKIYYHAFHISVIPGTLYKDIQSPYGYGGPISNCLDPLFLSIAWRVYCDWCVENNIIVEFMRFHPMLESAKWYSGAVMIDRKVVWIDLQSDTWSNYKGRIRTAIKKASNEGLEIEHFKSKEDIENFVSLYIHTMKSLNSNPFYHFSEDYFSEILNWSHAKLFITKFEGKTVGAALFLLHGKNAEYHLSASNAEGKRLGATNFILHEAVMFLKNYNYEFLHLGGGTDANPENLLLFFKKGFSKNQKDFYIGKKIFNETIYGQLKENWLGENKGSTEKILFYRF
ncbi:GNAT family N-acetyltransferase [Paenibacillus qinlingensis]|uniref:GNAT family N-acetyltransferase n=1 Tax=Paenibacillus qinlingensis TaxID=1837343 RepID=UPI0015642B0B|nr:GNAT family N-acetyltransferase [Paenibacillus qinlingensis]NQX61919.1 GNAT family N-acetyltransferase [Paenibacillus qinlingensis]